MAELPLRFRPDRVQQAWEQALPDASGDVIDVALGVFCGDVRMTASNFVYADQRRASARSEMISGAIRAAEAARMDKGSERL